MSGEVTEVRPCSWCREGEGLCDAEHATEPLYCTREPGHLGARVACGVEHVLASWPRSDERCSLCGLPPLSPIHHQDYAGQSRHEWRGAGTSCAVDDRPCPPPAVPSSLHTEEPPDKGVPAPLSRRHALITYGVHAAWCAAFPGGARYRAYDSGLCSCGFQGAAWPCFPPPGWSSAPIEGSASAFFRPSRERTDGNDSVAPAREQQQRCKACWRADGFDFNVPDETWIAVVPEALRNRVVCLACFDHFAEERAVEYAPHIQTLHFAGERTGLEWALVRCGRDGVPYHAGTGSGATPQPPSPAAPLCACGHAQHANPCAVVIPARVLCGCTRLPTRAKS